MKFLNFPQGVFTIAFGNLWDTFSYYGTQTILVLYLMHVFHFESGISYLVYGAYVSMSFSTPIFGGIIADRFLGSRNTALIGGVLAITGNLILMLHQPSRFFCGLSMALIGSGLYKCNATQMLGALYQKGAHDKEKGFTLLYLAINIGGTLAPLCYGLIIYQFHAWSLVFLINSIGIATSILLFLYNIKIYPTSNRLHKKQAFLALGGIILGMLFLFFSFSNIHFVLLAPIIVFILGMGYLIRTILQANKLNRRPLFGLLILSFFAMFYFSAGMQVGTTVTLFIQSVVKQFRLPASTFNMLYSGFVLILAPFFATTWAFLKQKKIHITLQQKVVIGILLAALGMLAFAMAAKTSLIFSNILLGYLLLSAGELVITPAVYTAISNNAAPELKSAMMGGWFLFIGMGSYLSAIFSKISMMTHSYAIRFSFFAMIASIAATGLFLALPKLNKMIHE